MKKIGLIFLLMCIKAYTMDTAKAVVLHYPVLDKKNVIHELFNAVDQSDQVRKQACQDFFLQNIPPKIAQDFTWYTVSRVAVESKLESIIGTYDGLEQNKLVELHALRMAAYTRTINILSQGSQDKTIPLAHYSHYFLSAAVMVGVYFFSMQL